MVKTALKNFFKNILYAFVPMGILYLFIIVAIVVLAKSLAGSAGTMLADLKELISSTAELSGISVSNFFSYAAEELQGSGNFFQTVKYIFDTDWLQRTVREFFGLLGESSATFTEQFTGIVSKFSTDIKIAVGVAVSWVTVGLALANFATGFVVRAQSAKRGMKKWLVANTLIPVIQALLLAATLLLTFFVQYFTLLVVLVLVIAFAYISLLSAWLVYGRGKVSYKETVTWKNVFFGLLAAFIVLAIVAAVFVLIFFLDPFVSVLVLVPLALYGMNVLSVNADSYVAMLAEQKTPEPAE